MRCLAETNRTPFDFAERERELVSGFNVEYGGGGFAMMFIAEYSAMIFFSLVTIVLFTGGSTLGIVMFLFGVFMMYLFVWVRVTYPRTRYDKLIMMAWTIILPTSLALIVIIRFEKFLL